MKIGPAGSGHVLEGLQKIHDAGLDAVEIEFTHSIFMSQELAKEVRNLNKKLGLAISVHAPYYINLAAKEPEKREASIQRIVRSCERAGAMGAGPVVFHPGFYMGRNPDDVFEIIKEGIFRIKELTDVTLAPETSGKFSQFGSLAEILKLSKEAGCSFCVDFAHLKARGEKDIFSRLAGRNIHAHYSGIEYGEKGEKKHLRVDTDEFRKLAMELKKHNIDATIICESPEPFEDALQMNKIISELYTG